MSKYKVLILIIILFSNCTDNEQNEVPQPIVGKWKLIREDLFSENQLLKISIIKEENLICPDYMEFKPKNNYEHVDKNINCQSNILEKGTYTFDGKILKTIHSGIEEDARVLDLTDVGLEIQKVYFEKTELRLLKKSFIKIE